MLIFKINYGLAAEVEDSMYLKECGKLEIKKPNPVQIFEYHVSPKNEKGQWKVQNIEAMVACMTINGVDSGVIKEPFW